MRWNQWKGKITFFLVFSVLLAVAFWYGGNAPGSQGWSVKEPVTENRATVPADPLADTKTETPAMPQDQQSSEQGEAVDPPADPVSSGEDGAAAPEQDSSEAEPSKQPPSPEPEESKPPEPPGSDPADPAPEKPPLPVESAEVEPSDTAYTCTISISCATVLEHMDWLDPEKTDLVPADGWILPATEVTFYEGESVFHVLQRTCKQNKIPMEFSNTPMYHSAYIEGIYNLYEFDCGELSGWMYQVNGWFPNYGCSRYALQDGDVICWLYSCDQGADVGGSNAAEG